MCAPWRSPVPHRRTALPRRCSACLPAFPSLLSSRLLLPACLGIRRRDLLNTYGHQHVLTLASLAKAGLLLRREGRRSAFPAAKQQLRLLLQEGEAIDEAAPKVTMRCGGPKNSILLGHTH